MSRGERQGERLLPDRKKQRSGALATGLAEQPSRYGSDDDKSKACPRDSKTEQVRPNIYICRPSGEALVLTESLSRYRGQKRQVRNSLCAEYPPLTKWHGSGYVLLVQPVCLRGSKWVEKRRRSIRAGNHIWEYKKCVCDPTRQ